MIASGDLQWAAGFLEVEGCWPLGGSTLTITAVQVQKWPLDRLLILFGGRIYRRSPAKNPNAQPQWQWVLHGWKAAGLSMTLFRLMSPKRKERMRMMLLAWIPKPVQDKMRHFCVRGHVYVEGSPYEKSRSKRFCIECIRTNGRERYRRRFAPHMAGLPPKTSGARRKYA